MTTIPAAANIGVALAYGDASSWRGSMLQLAINLASLLFAGIAVLGVQRVLYRRRRLAHLRDPVRVRAGLPIGRSRRGTHALSAAELRELERSSDVPGG